MNLKKYGNEVKIPEIIKNYLAENKDTKEIILHFDNDVAGIKATNSFIKYLNKDYIIRNSPTPIGKDINDYLCIKKGIKEQNEVQKSDVFVQKEVPVLA